MNVLDANPDQLRKLIKYPAIVDFRVIVDADCKDAVEQVAAACRSVESDGIMPLKEPSRKSRTGKYLSYKQEVKVSSYENLHAIYAKVGALDCVKHIL